MASDAQDWDDAALARRCASREDVAWRELLRRAGPAARGVMRRAFARAGLPDPVREAEEALGGWALALLRSGAAALRAYRPPTPLRVYAAAVARNVAVDLIRKRRQPLPLTHDVAAPVLPELPASPRQLEAAMARLPSRDRLLLRLVYWDGRSYAEAARGLGVAEASVGPLLHRAREALRGLLEEKEKSRPE